MRFNYTPSEAAYEREVERAERQRVCPAGDYEGMSVEQILDLWADNWRRERERLEAEQRAKEAA